MASCTAVPPKEGLPRAPARICTSFGKSSVKSWSRAALWSKVTRATLSLPGCDTDRKNWIEASSAFAISLVLSCVLPLLSKSRTTDKGDAEAFVTLAMSCCLPSSRIVKSVTFKSGTAAPCLSVTETRTFTVLAWRAATVVPPGPNVSRSKNAATKARLLRCRLMVSRRTIS